MLFTSTIFIFLFLPFVLCLYLLLEGQYKNFFLLLVSLFFYAFGEPILVLLIVLSIVFNYTIGRGIEKYQKREQQLPAKILLWCGIGFNLSLLFYYKYINFFLQTIIDLTRGEHMLELPAIALPIGISFFTFQGVSYVVDVYKREIPSQKSLINFGMYISLFPQLIAGPIVRYVDIIEEIKERTITTALFKEGINRFIIGFAKKVFIANSIGEVVDVIFATPANDLPTSLAWFGAFCYTLQIYYDFSGYSDMAIGIGKMLGFNFKENFRHPYIATSIQEFWRRWHISLSTWFRDYLYIPLGGNRAGKYRTYFNLALVFGVTGLWHGASWNFIIWGFFHGGFIILERFQLFKLPLKLHFLKHVYLLLVVMIGWVLFRAENLQYALDFIHKMFAFVGGVISDNTAFEYLDNQVYIAILIGTLFALPLRHTIEKKLTRLAGQKFIFIKELCYLCIFILSIMEVAQATYQPFIYFKF